MAISHVHSTSGFSRGVQAQPPKRNVKRSIETIEYEFSTHFKWKWSAIPNLKNKMTFHFF